MLPGDIIIFNRATIPTSPDDALICISGAGREAMFTRTPDMKVVNAETAKAADPISLPPLPTETGERSVIGNDLTILGQGLKIIGRGVLQIDGDLSSDVQATEVLVGEKGKVTGMVAGQQVTVQGTVAGSICAKSVTLQSTSDVEGDVHHMSLSVDQGAKFEGRSRRVASEEDLEAVVTRKAS